MLSPIFILCSFLLLSGVYADTNGDAEPALEPAAEPAPAPETAEDTVTDAPAPEVTTKKKFVPHFCAKIIQNFADF